jgi:hypothetical protein
MGISRLRLTKQPERRPIMTQIINNEFAIQYKIFGTEAGSDFVAIIFPADGFIDSNRQFELYVNGTKTDALS